MLSEQLQRSTLLDAAIPVPRQAPGSLVDLTARLDVPADRSFRAWLRRHVAVVAVVDTVLAAVAAVLVLAAHPAEIGGAHALLWASLSLVVVWPLLLRLSGAYNRCFVGAGNDEFRRVAHAGLALLAILGFVSYAGALELSRGLVVLAVPLLILGTLVGRFGARRRLHAARQRGKGLKRVVVVGRGSAVLELIERMNRTPHAGLAVVAACVTTPDRARVAQVVGLPVAGLDEVVDVAGRVRADAVAVTSASETASQYLRSLSWQLEGTGLELLVAPGLVEVAGPRLHVRPYDALPLLAVEQPRFDGWRLVAKATLDRCVAVLCLLLLAPVLAGVALAVRLSSPGPVLYRQQRIGIGGRPFTMLKFRSMVVGADQQVASLSDGNDADGLLFKLRQDPRVTPVGTWLRRLSLDELPQLLNVLAGTMSLVGPRPPLPGEVARYDSAVGRRLKVKPGLTGLWQISGRSDLPWEEAVRLDLRYVENWSLTLDIQILWKTARAVLRGAGAY